MRRATKIEPPPLKWIEEFEARHGKVVRVRKKGAAPKPEPPSAEAIFAQSWEREREPLSSHDMVRELVFHPERKWRFDFAWPASMLALEIEGMGRHQTFIGFREDCVKYNAALLLGWRVLRVMAAEKRHVNEWVEMVKAAIETPAGCILSSSR